MKQAEKDTRWINRQELADLLQVHIITTYRGMALPPRLRLSRRKHLWDRQEVEKWIKARTTK